MRKKSEPDKLPEEIAQPDQPTEEITLENTSLATGTFMMGCEVTPYTKPDGKVGFRIRGPVSEALSAIYANKPVPINDFLKALAFFRQAVFTLKKKDIK